MVNIESSIGDKCPPNLMYESFKKSTKMGTFCIIKNMSQSNWITYSYDHDPSKTTDIVLTF